MSDLGDIGVNYLTFALNSIAENIKKDGAALEFISASDADRNKYALAYFRALSKKMDRIQEIYHTTPEARDLFNTTVLGLIQR